MQSKSEDRAACTSSNSVRASWARVRASLPWIVGIAFVLRVAWIIVGHTYKFKTADDNFSFGWEMGRIGTSIASGHGFSNPFGPPTGPTAWEPPLYPYLIAGVFQVFGIYSKASAFVLLAFNSACSALTCVPIFLIARRVFSEKVAVGSAWAWALLPNVMFWCTRAVWETSLSALLLAVIFWLSLTLEELDGIHPWLGFGLLWGVAALNSTSLLAFLPAAGLWAWYRRAKLGKRSLPGAVLASVVFIACIAPWLVRDYRTFGKFIFLRDNFGAELRLGNGPGATGAWMEWEHPTQNAPEMQRFISLGELEYINARKQEATQYIREDYSRFAWLCGKRFLYFWAGPPKPRQALWLTALKNSLYLASSVLALWGLIRALQRHKPGAWLFFWLVLCFPAIYYVVFTMPRYRHPMEPELAILCVFAIVGAARQKSASVEEAFGTRNS
jgi:4-amino-4-deoxy-L-arabinose transferase-like glycosyltransferase